MTQAETAAARDTLLEEAYARLVAALNAQPPGAEAAYLARVVLILMNELQYSDAAFEALAGADAPAD